MQPPCLEEEIERLRMDLPKRLGASVPERYFDLLRISNGISTENPLVYASRESRHVASDIVGRELYIPGIIEENESLRLDRPTYSRLIVFATSSLYVHALDVRTGKFIFCLNPEQPDELYDTFDQFMISTLWLGLTEEFRPDPWKRTRPRW
jgi:hypothetical protein